MTDLGLMNVGCMAQQWTCWVNFFVGGLNINNGSCPQINSIFSWYRKFAKFRDFRRRKAAKILVYIQSHHYYRTQRPKDLWKTAVSTEFVKKIRIDLPPNFLQYIKFFQSLFLAFFGSKGVLVCEWHFFLSCGFWAAIYW